MTDINYIDIECFDDEISSDVTECSSSIEDSKKGIETLCKEIQNSLMEFEEREKIRSMVRSTLAETQN